MLCYMKQRFDLVIQIFLIVILFLSQAYVMAEAAPVSLSVTYLRCEYKVDPLGIDVMHPRLSWQILATERGVIQGAFQIQVAESVQDLRAGRSLVWDTGRTVSDASIHLVYDGTRLESGKRYYWHVRIWDHQGTASTYSAPAFWEMGLLDPSDWQADWITPDLDEDRSTSQPAPMLRSTFIVEGDVVSARLYTTSLGLYEMELNGRRVSDQLFTPGWTSYDTRVQYQTYDVTDYFRVGENAIAAMLGDGWYRGNLAWDGNRNIYGEKLALLAQLNITFADGRVHIVGTGPDWKASTGPILMSDIYDGERYDARLEKDGWSEAGYDDGGWAGVTLLDHSKEILIAQAGPPVKRIEEIRPIEIVRTPEGDTVVDMGQNMVGWVRLRVTGPAGTTVTLRHAEVLDREGNFYTENLRNADQTVQYTLKGNGEEIYEPYFTFQGFRYVAVDGFPGRLSLDNLTGVVIHSDMTPTGTFETSNDLLNRLQHNILWGQKGNFLDVPTDCPQRDERLGWTGDAQVFARTAAFNMDVAGFFWKWLADLAADQKPNGAVPHVIPDILSRGSEEGGGATGWADAALVIPWTMYLSFGDTRILDTQYESMKAWVEYMRAQAGERLIWDSGSHFGDWLAYATTRSDYPGATTDKDFIATAYFAHSSDLLRKTAAVLGKTADAVTYTTLFHNIREALQEEFMTSTGRLSPNTQTAYALALSFDLLPENLREAAAERLANDVRSFGNHLTTGFLGTPLLCRALSDNGYLDVAYDLLNQETYPSWLYPVRMGATTIWERWDGIKPDGTFQDEGMNSYNHYAYGAIGAWLYSVVAGIDIDPKEPGYKHILIRPQPGGRLTSVRASLQSMYGEIGTEWEQEEGVFSLSVTVPPNTTATVCLPGAVLDQVLENGAPVSEAEGIQDVSQDGDDVNVDVASGQYAFTFRRPDM